jgi:hypothetical protein
MSSKTLPTFLSSVRSIGIRLSNDIERREHGAGLVASVGGRYSVSQACYVVATLGGAPGALHRAGLSNRRVARAGDRIGRHAYRAASLDFLRPFPEAASQPACSPDADLAGLGSLLLLLLAGVSVVQPLEPAALTERVAESRPDVKPSVIAVIQRCFSGDPQFRFSSTADLEGAIRVAITEGLSPQTG